MNLREQARRAGGDELVAQLDRAAVLERDIFKQVSVIVEDSVRGFEGTEEQARLAAACEALSSALANATAILTIKAFSSRSDGIMTAVKSLSGNLNKAFEDIDAIENGVSGKIKKLIDKLGPLKGAE